MVPPVHAPHVCHSSCLCVCRPDGSSCSFSRFAVDIIRVATAPATCGAKADESDAEDEEDNEGDDAHLWG